MATLPSYWNLHSMMHSLKSKSYNGNTTSTATRKTAARWSKNRNTTQQDQRSTATTSPTASWTDHELHQDQSSHPGLLQDDFSFLKIDFSSRRKQETTKAREKAKATTKEAKAKASTGAKDTTRDRQRQQRKLQQRRIQQEQRKRLLRIQRLWIKQGLQRPRNLAKHDMPPMWQAWPLGPGLQSACMAHRRRRRTTFTRTRRSRSGQP